MHCLQELLTGICDVLSRHVSAYHRCQRRLVQEDLRIQANEAVVFNVERKLEALRHSCPVTPLTGSEARSL